MKLENSNLKESVIKMMERRYCHIHVVTWLVHFCHLVDQVTDKKRKKKEKQKMSFRLTNVLVTGFEVNLTGLLEKDSNVTKISWGDQIHILFLAVCLFVLLPLLLRAILKYWNYLFWCLCFDECSFWITETLI